MKKITGLHNLYAKNSILADEVTWGRKTDPISRRGFLRNSGLITMSAALGASIPFAKNMPAGLIPAAFAQTDQLFELFGKERVEKELEEFLSHKFFKRFGGGIGLTRLARAYQMMKDEHDELHMNYGDVNKF